MDYYSIIPGIIASFIASTLILLARSYRPDKLPRFFQGILMRLALGRLGIIRILHPSTDAYPMITEQLKTSRDARILQVRGHDFITDKKHAILKRELKHRTDNGFATRMLLVHPESQATADRARQISTGEKAFRLGIQASIKELEYLRGNGMNIDLRLYNFRPIFSLSIFDNLLTLSFYSEGRDRQIIPALVIKSETILYSAFKNYFDCVWEEQSTAPTELSSYHYEIELKAKVFDPEAVIQVLQDLNAESVGSKRYHDHYFTPVEGPHAEKTGNETRIRCDLTNGRMFRTEKHPFNDHMDGSKRELETYAGANVNFPTLQQSILTSGYREYSSFYKFCSNYILYHGTVHVNISLTSISSTLTENQDNMQPDFIEIEVIQPDGTNQESLRQDHKVCKDVLTRFGVAASGPVSETYSSKFEK